MVDSNANRYAGTVIPQVPALAELVFDALRDRIVMGDFGPGDDIVIEHLASEFGVSATPVREAVARLLHDGLVQKVPGGRLRMRQLNRSYLIDTFRVRAALEGLAAELAATHAGPDDINVLQQYLRSIYDSLSAGEYEAYVSADDSFHNAITRMSNNQQLSSLLPTIHFQTAFIRRSTQQYFQDFSSVICDEHRSVFDAIARQDPNAARRSMETHVQLSGERNAHVLGLHE